MISEPSPHCVSTVHSGEKKWRDPSYGERNFTPSGMSLANGFHDFPFARENAWNHHESVSISWSRFSKECSQPAFWTVSAPGWRNRWNVFARIKLIGGNPPVYLGSRSKSKISHLIVAFVQTGIKTGVCTVTQLRVNSPALAFHFVASTLNCNFFSIV